MLAFPTSKMYLNCPTFLMMPVAGGEFGMGEENASVLSNPVKYHKVALADFEIGCYPVTQELWKLVFGKEMQETYCQEHQDKHPIIWCNWEKAQQFIKALNSILKIRELNDQEGRQFQLPTEAQWEYAARGGQKSQSFPYAGGHRLDEVGWYGMNSHLVTKPVGLKLPNELGLFDMSGSVWEWCADYWHDSYLFSSYSKAPSDGSAWVDANLTNRRVLRGGDIINVDEFCRATSRTWLQDKGRYFGERVNNIGFRLARY